MEKWKLEAKCAGMNPDVFFPPRTNPQRTRDTKAICNGTHDGIICPVRGHCLAAAIRDCEHGVWGGTSHQERERIEGRSLRSMPNTVTIRQTTP